MHTGNILDVISKRIFDSHIKSMCNGTEKQLNVCIDFMFLQIQQVGHI